MSGWIEQAAYRSPLHGSHVRKRQGAMDEAVFGQIAVLVSGLLASAYALWLGGCYAKTMLGMEHDFPVWLETLLPLGAGLRSGRWPAAGCGRQPRRWVAGLECPGE